MTSQKQIPEKPAQKSQAKARLPTFSVLERISDRYAEQAFKELAEYHQKSKGDIK